MSASTSHSMPAYLPEQDEPASGEGERVRSALSTAELGEQCLLQLGIYGRGEPSDESYGLELFRRATVEGDQEAWAWVQRCFGEIVRAWLRRHPSRAVACRLESEATYAALAFKTLAAALHYLRASLHGAILDTLRAYARRAGDLPPAAQHPGAAHA